jgi:hypothetical protein
MADTPATPAKEEAAAPAKVETPAEVVESNAAAIAALLPELSHLLEHDGLAQMVRDAVRKEVSKQLTAALEAKAAEKA